MIEYTAVQIAKFTCDSCLRIEKVCLGVGMPDGWKAVSGGRHHCPSCVCSRSCKKHCR